jgi:hypothetical protein
VDNPECSLLWSDIKLLTPVCVSAEGYMELTLIHIPEAGAYKDREWCGLPHTMLTENTKFSVHK